MNPVWGFEKKNIVMTCGHSIINKTSNTDVGSLMLKHGGGGHARVGTCQVPVEDADSVLEALISRMNTDGPPCPAVTQPLATAGR